MDNDYIEKIFDTDPEFKRRAEHYKLKSARICGCGNVGDAMKTACRAVEQMVEHDCDRWNSTVMELTKTLFANMVYAKALGISYSDAELIAIAEGSKTLGTDEGKDAASRQAAHVFMENAVTVAQIITYFNAEEIGNMINGPILEAFKRRSPHARQ